MYWPSGLLISCYLTGLLKFSVNAIVAMHVDSIYIIFILNQATRPISMRKVRWKVQRRDQKTRSRA